MSQVQAVSVESDADLTSLLLSLCRTRWTTCHLLQWYRDMLPKPYMPLPPPELGQLHGEGTHVRELAATSVSNDVQDAPQHLSPSKTFKSQANSYSLFWLYNHDTLPINDPEDTSGSTDHIGINLDANPFHPYPNKNLLLLGDWYWNQGTVKLRKSFRSLLNIVGSSEFRSEDIWDTEWTKIDCKLGTLVAPEEHTSTSGSPFEWLNNDAGWKSTSVTISIPFPHCSVKPGPVAYTVQNFCHCSLIGVIHEKVINPWNHHVFQYEPYVLCWHPPHKTCEIGVHGELFTSESFINAHNCWNWQVACSSALLIDASTLIRRTIT